MRFLRRLAKLPAAELGLRARAALVLGAVRAALWLLPFRAVRALARRASRPPAGRGPGRGPCRAELARSVASAARFVPGSTCLARALAEGILLGRAGHPARVRLGVARGTPGGIRAHAWVEAGDAERLPAPGGYLPLATL